MEKQKVIIFTTAYFPFVGGAEIAIEEITKRLKDRFDFYIITSRFRRSLPKREVRPEGTVIRIGFGTRLDKWLLPICTVLSTVQNSTKYGTGALLFGVDISQGSLAAAVYKFFHPKTKFIFNIQYGYGEERLKKGRFGMLAITFRFILKQADHVTAISNHLSGLAKEYGYKGQVEVISNGVDLQKFRIKNLESRIKNKSSKIIITTSRLVPKNGIDILIKAIAEVKKEIPDIQCWIVGDGPERNKLELEARSFKLETNLKFFGEILHDQIPEYLHQADVFVRPSRSEGMGNSFVEAIAAGLLVVGTPVGGIPDIIRNQETGIFARVDDPMDLAEKIKLLLTDPVLAMNMIENGMKVVEEKFSWDKIAEKYASLLAETKPLRIMIATPLLPPQLGGPAQYAQNLSKEFSFLGHKVELISFGKYLRFPSGIRHLGYIFALIRNAMKYDVIFALDYTSVGLPAALVSLLFRKPMVIRVEGDFLWESFIERTRQDTTLQEFYKNSPKLLLKERLTKSLSRWVMCRANLLVFSSEWRQKMIVDAYTIPLEKTKIIHNVFPFVRNSVNRQRGNFILWAGRMLYLKNIQLLIRAFADINVSSYELHLIGEGPERKNLENLTKKCRAEDRIMFFPPMSHEELMNKVASATAIVLPSLSDVGPNIIAEALANLVPVIMTKESGYAEIFRDNVILIDPLDEKDFHQKLERFIKKPAARSVPNAGFYRSWDAAAKDWINLFKIL